jgi:RNA polymerase sigma-70 factor, ECF subfamily
MDKKPMIDAEDPILVRRALEADAEAFGRLCRRYYPPLVAMADAILQDHHLAEDAAQEALAHACRQLPGLKKPELFGPWVGAICRNVAKDMLRKRQRQATVPEASDPLQAGPDSSEGQTELLAEALRHLAPPLREVVYMRFYNDMSYQQMARVLGRTPQSIDGRLRRAKKEIAAYLARRGFWR